MRQVNYLHFQSPHQKLNKLITMKFQLAAVASLGVSASFEASIWFESPCPSESIDHLDSIAKVNDALYNADDSCTRAYLKYTYKFDSAKRCDFSDDSTDLYEHIVLKSVADDLRLIKMRRKSLLLESLQLFYPAIVKDGCKNAKLFVVDRVDGDSCGEILTKHSVMVTEFSSSVKFSTVPQVQLNLRKIEHDLLTNVTGCPEDDAEATEVTVMLLATYDLTRPTPSPSPSSSPSPAAPSKLEVSFADADCSPTECESLTDSESVLSCLAAAASDPNCSSATYTRSFTALETLTCDESTTTKLHMSLQSVRDEEERISSDDKQTTIVEAHFSKSPKDPVKCKEPTLMLAGDCFAGGITSDMAPVSEKTTLAFTGDQAFDFTSNDLDLVVDYPDAIDGCELTDVGASVKVTVKTLLTLPRVASSSASLAHFSLAGFLMAAAYILGAF